MPKLLEHHGPLSHSKFLVVKIRILCQRGQTNKTNHLPSPAVRLMMTKRQRIELHSDIFDVIFDTIKQSIHNKRLEMSVFERLISYESTPEYEMLEHLPEEPFTLHDAIIETSKHYILDCESHRVWAIVTCLMKEFLRPWISLLFVCRDWNLRFKKIFDPIQTLRRSVYLLPMEPSAIHPSHRTYITSIAFDFRQTTSLQDLIEKRDAYVKKYLLGQ